VTRPRRRRRVRRRSPLGRVVLDDEEFAALRSPNSFRRSKAAPSLGRERLAQAREGTALESVVPLLGDRPICTGMWRVEWSCFTG